MAQTSRIQARRRLRDRAEAALVILVATIVTVLVGMGWVPLLNQGETWFADVRATMMADAGTTDDEAGALNDDIVIIAIRETSLARLPYASPIDRGLLAEAVEVLGRKGARAIGLDIIIDRPTEPDKDRRLRQALLDFPGPAVVAYADAEGGLDEAGAAYLRAFSNGIGRGWPNVLRDAEDGTVRWLTTRLDVPGEVRDGLVAAIARALGYPVPEGRPRLDYQAGSAPGKSPFRILPIEQVANLPDAWLAGRIVLIGADMRDVDRLRVPKAVLVGATEGMIPGVVVHAHMLAQIIEGRIVPELGLAGHVLVALFAVGSGVGLALARLPWPLLLLNSGAALAVVLGAGFLSTLKAGPDLPVIAPVLGHLGAYAAGVAFVGRRMRREKRFIRDAFARYVAPALVDELEADPGRLVLGGERREVTLLFSDIAGFTKLSEGMDAQALGRLLNDYFDGLCAIVIAHEGTIDKLIGDAVVAIFGAPVPRADHAERAVACALAMDAFAERFRRDQQALGIALGATRIGVHSGTATVGNFGGQDRFNYTALGDTVNTAARLEGANKALGTRVCVSAVTAALCRNQRFRPVADVVVKGKSEAVSVVEPLADAASDDGYATAYQALKDESAGAAGLFERLAALAPDDGVVAAHLARLRAGARGTRIVLEEK